MAKHTRAHTHTAASHWVIVLIIRVAVVARAVLTHRLSGDTLSICVISHTCYDNSLVDPASSHMLVSKIKPCMSKYESCLHDETADGSLNQLWSKWARVLTWITVVIPELIHATMLRRGCALAVPLH